MTTPNNNLFIILRPTIVSDLDILFEFQLDPEGGYLAAFMPANHTDKAAYIAKHSKFLENPDINNQTILADNKIVGSIAKFMMEGSAEITYWIDRDYRGRGIASEALKKFLAIEPARPIFGRVAFDNTGSQKVLEKNGFERAGTDRGFASARQAEIEEYIYKLV